MGPMYFVMAIMGCGDGGQCAQVRVERTRYVSALACRADQAAALARNSDLDYPVISAACRANGPEMVQRARPDAPKRG